MGSIKTLFISIIKYFEWETVFFTQSIEEYASAKGKLNDKNIMVKTKIINNSSGFSRSGRSGDIKNSYEIMVKSEAVFLANEILYK